MSFVIQRPDGLSQRVAGYHDDMPEGDVADYVARDLSGSRGDNMASLPASVDLRAQLPPVIETAHVESCVCRAVAVAASCVLARKLGERPTQPSTFFLYRHTRAAIDPGQDGGSTIEQAINALRKHGVCPLESHPDASGWQATPSLEATQQGEAFKQAASLVEPVSIPVELDLWRDCLSAGYPIVFGVSICASFDVGRLPGLIPTPSERDVKQDGFADHVMVCVGYSDAERVFIVRNNWGPNWGDQGYGFLPYGYVMDESFNAGDAWVLRLAQTLPAAAAAQAEGVLPDHEGEVAEMADEDYRMLLDALESVSLDTRLAQLFLIAADADSGLPPSELYELTDALERSLIRLGSTYEAPKVLDSALALVADEALLDETVALLGEHLSEDTLAFIVNQLGSAAGIEDISSEENGLLRDLVDSWLDGAIQRSGGLVDGLSGEYAPSSGYDNGVYGDDEEEEDDDKMDGYNIDSDDY